MKFKNLNSPGKNAPIVALVGNPNVGKSTIFNNLTGMHQHTGNWAGKTVSCAEGKCIIGGREHLLIDLPGTYSLAAQSAEEAVARDFICSDTADIIVVVCDAVCLERSLILALQILELNKNVIICISLMDEAQRKGIYIGLQQLSRRLGTPVVGVTGRSKKSLAELKRAIENFVFEQPPAPFCHPTAAEKALPAMDTAAATVNAAADICRESVKYSRSEYSALDRRLDRIISGRFSAWPVMLLLLLGIFWLTIEGANYPSEILATLLFRIQDLLSSLFTALNAPSWLHGAVVLGIYRVLAWVISVMLPPMAIFFPLFTLLEDAGLLPRIAYNLDKPFQHCKACGKQALCMAMGFGCNAVGIAGSRIIDSPRERLLAILTNNFVPCNGRFSALIALLIMFFTAQSSTAFLPALLMTLTIAFSICLTLGTTRILSSTLLKGKPAPFILELPPYRKPQIGRVILRSIFDRTLFVLSRAIAVAAPAGLIIWTLANISPGGISLLMRLADFLDPFARIIGLDGIILTAFILSFPANEIALPLMLMAYTAQGTLSDAGGLGEVHQLLVANGWTMLTAASTIIFLLCHWPCSTALITAWHETRSAKWTAITALLPTAVGILLCLLLNTAAGLIR